MELRDIEIFLTLAEELHFGRAAARLHVSPARVSQAIKKQERMVGAPLFERTSRKVMLTVLGERLRADLRPIYQGLLDSLERTRLAALGKTQMLRVGTIASNAYDLRPYWQTFRARHPEVDLRIRHSPFNDAFDPLRNGEIDALITWLPVEESDLTVGPVVHIEPLMMVVSPDSELASRETVSLETLADRAVLHGTGNPEYYEDAFIPFFTPRGQRVTRHAKRIGDLEDIFNLVGTGEAVHLLGEHAVRYHVRPDIVYLPVRDGAMLRWALVWRTDRENDLIRALAQAVRDTGTLRL
ncbi:LysR family transcriptional regulator [Nonomuraea longicatena]|uniref:LysR family transcriptional regulator n=1 Tax=Nonomuraea longicatena TaxID=83682 RepID=UPI0031DCA767